MLESQGRNRRDKALYFLIPLRTTGLNIFRWAIYIAMWASVMHSTSSEIAYIYVLKAMVRTRVCLLSPSLPAPQIALHYLSPSLCFR